MTQRKRMMQMEALEGRSLMAGDVFATIKLGSLKIEGDNQANEIAIVDLGGGKVEITGQNSTNINGGASAVLSGFTSNVKIQLRGGDDVVSWKGIETHSIPLFKIETGSGNDSVAVDQLFAGIGEIETGAGNDQLDLLAAKARILSLETGAGDDTVRLGSSSLATPVSMSVAMLKIETGLGNDQVQLQNLNLNASNVKIESGSGDDNVLVRKISGEATLKLSAGAGTDTVAIEDSTLKSLGAELGSGDGDDLKITSVKSARTKLSGGLGAADKLSIASSDLGALNRSGFEIQ